MALDKGFTLWLTGLSGAGKSTIALELKARLKERGLEVELLDGDEVRTNLSKGLGFSKDDRDTNIRRIGYVSRLLARNGVGVISAAISPYRQIRDEVRAETENDGAAFIEVFVKCPIDVLAERDVKGLYKKALAGEIKEFTGISDPYEEPENPDITVETDRESVDESTKRIIRELERRSVLRGSTILDNDKKQKGEKTMTVRLGDTAPDFTAETTEGTIKFHEWLGNGWGVLFSHPKDYTPVCTTELGETARLKPEFEQRNVKVIGLSVDPLDRHQGWAKDIAETQGTAVNFPVIADEKREVADLYDMIHPNASDTHTVRSVFVIGPDKKVKLTLTYPASTGRNFGEILRVIDSLQLTADYSVATPVNWTDGDDVIISTSISDADAEKAFPSGWTAVKPYLRLTKQPNKEAAAAAE